MDMMSVFLRTVLIYFVMFLLLRFIIQLVLAIITLKNRRVGLQLEGKPSLVIIQGLLKQKEMKKRRYEIALRPQLEQIKMRDTAGLEFALLEPSGKPGKIRYEGLPLPLIMDGKVQDDQLAKLGQTRFWLKNQLQEMGIFDFKQVFFCSINHRGRIFVNRKR